MLRTGLALAVLAAALVVGAAPSEPASAEASTPRANSDLNIQLSELPDFLTVGNEPASYELRIANNGPQRARRVRVAVALVGGIRFAGFGSADGDCKVVARVVKCSFGAVPRCRPLRVLAGPPSPHSNPCERTASIALRATGAGPARVAASVSSRNLDPNRLNNRFARSVDVRPGPALADLEVEIAPSQARVAVGSQLEYAITVTNRGPSEAMRVLIQHHRPLSLQFRSFESRSRLAGPQPTLSGCDSYARLAESCIPRLPPDSSVVFRIGVLPDHDAIGTVDTSVDVSTSTLDLIRGNNSGVTRTTVTPPAATADLGLTLVALPDPVRIGNLLVYSAMVENHGPDAAEGVEFHSEVFHQGSHPELQLLGTSTSHGTCDTRVVCRVGRLNAGEIAAITMTTLVTRVEPGPFSLGAGVLSSTFDPSLFDVAAAPDSLAISVNAVDSPRQRPSSR